jgi:hypothetical protein
VPSLLMISQMTAAGPNPAMAAKSTEASVCPARSSTPPGLARSGNMWPGLTKSEADAPGAVATAIVRARSEADIPVVIPNLASTLTVKAVANLAEFVFTIG